MKKIMLMTALFLGFVAANAQTAKIGYLNYASVILDLPDYKKAEDSLRKYSAELEKGLMDITKEYEEVRTKMQNRMSGPDAKSPNTQRMVEIDNQNLQKLELAYQEMQKEIEGNLAQRQEDLMKPMREKIDQAIEAVAKEKGFTMALDASVVLYKRDTDDIENFVRTKLKVITKEESEKKRKENTDLRQTFGQ